jgi:predicted lipid-binding transport protein (Tim44 family)
MRTFATFLLISAMLWAAETARGQVPRIPVIRPPVFRPPVPPVRVGPHVPHVSLHHFGNGGGPRNEQEQAIQDEAILWIVIGLITLGVLVFLWIRWRKNRRFSTVASSVELPADLIHPPEAVARRVRETERLLNMLAAQDPRVAPPAFRDLVRSVFTQAQRCWEARQYGPMIDMLTTELYVEHTSAVGVMRRLHLINRLIGVSIDRLELVHVRWPEGDEGQELTALVTFQAVSEYVSDRGIVVTGSQMGPTRFQEFWVFRRQRDGWKLAALEMTRKSTRLEEPNEVTALVGTGGQAI